MSKCWKMYKLLLILIVLSPLFVSANDGEFYTSGYGNSFYVKKDKEFSWYDAIHVCASKNMSLITPDTEKKHLEVTKLISSLNLTNGVWTSGQETDNLNFLWTTTGNNVTYTKWGSGEPTRIDSKTHCIRIYMATWASYPCINLRYVICEENPILKGKCHELDALKIQQSAELNKMKSYYETETNIKLQELRQSYQNQTQEMNDYKRNLESCEMQRASELNEFKKLQENDSSHLLDEMQREISVLKTDCERHLNQLTLANKSLELKFQENEMLKKFHAMELQLLEEKQNYALNSLKNSYDILANRTSVNKFYKLILNAQGNYN